MKITLEKSGFENIKADAYIFMCYEDKKLFDGQIKLIQKLLKLKITGLSLEDFKGKKGQTALIYTPTKRIILSGLGMKSDKSLERLRIAVYGTIKKAKDLKIRKIAIEILNDQFLSAGYEEIACAEAVSLVLSNYDFAKYYTSKEKKGGSSLREVVFFAEKKLLEKYSKDIEMGMKTGKILGDAVNLAKDLGNEPSNVLYPASYCDLIVERSQKDKKYTAEALSLKDIEKLGMGGVLAVAKGSLHEPRFLILKYNGAGDDEKPYVIVGKGVTFDSGGISIKPASGMSKMKMDMCGSAATVGVIEAVSKLRLKLNLICLIPMVENMPGGNAFKPGDVVTAYNGKTIEIDNTDAEGRLILADALSYADQFKPAAVIDMATLTGAAVIALGNVASALMSNNQNLADKLIEAGHQTYDRVWQLPLWDEYDEMINSDIADVRNSGIPKQAGTIVAGMFLKRFIGNYPWAHVDIAATAMRDSRLNYIPKNATGAGVRLVAQYLMNEAKK